MRAATVVLTIFLLAIAQGSFSLQAASKTSISFNRDIRPILSENCFKCHGADDKGRKSKLRLDDATTALQPAKSGQRAFIAGKPNESELIKRILSTDPDEVMPPPSTKKSLSSEQKRLLQDWVAAGAKYETHWAFVAPHQSPLPKVKAKTWPQNAVDYFTLARLEKEGLQPSPRAGRHALVRRLYLDLIGLPPTPDEADAFVNDTGPKAVERLVDRLMDSPQYGERWARRWLDLARYADTNGYEKDRARSIWPYRDWVIQSLNDDMPFDQFTIKQIAGDMLPNATVADRVATGFHRNTMLNEEGGADPLEFRYHAMVDRVSTTGTAWLGLTIGCAQCHTHKYDPITHHEYYRVMALLNNAEEPKMDILTPELQENRKEIEGKIAQLEMEMPSKFLVDDLVWQTPFTKATTKPGTAAMRSEDNSWQFDEQETSSSTFTFTIENDLDAKSFRLETFPNKDLPKQGTGFSASGNFVLSEVRFMVSGSNSSSELAPVKLAKATADFSQTGFGIDKAIDGDLKTGWAISPQETKDHTATFELEKPIKLLAGTRCEVQLEQQHGSKHVLGRVRLSLGVAVKSAVPLEVRRREAFEKSFTAWLELEAAKAIRWTVLKPTAAKSNEPILTILDDYSVLASGDQTKKDTYEVSTTGPLQNITAIRLEALPHPSLPRGGPGRAYYEGPEGDFLLCEFKATTRGKSIKFKSASVDFANGGSAVGSKAGAGTIDDDPLTGWSIGNGDGKPHAAVFVLGEPLTSDQGLQLSMIFEKYFACGLGRFRISVTSDRQPAEARGLSTEVESSMIKPEPSRTPADQVILRKQFMNNAPQLAEARQEIQKLRDSSPKATTTLVMSERPAASARKTHLHNRGEFLQPVEEVFPGVPAFLSKFDGKQPTNRLEFAQWLVSQKNPLTARVMVNRQWQAFFGRGLVRTLEDFGFQGAAPSHPELLDWLAVEFRKQRWSFKQLHKLIVTSATYQQSSDIRAELTERDPQNILLARGPRYRVDAELVRDATLRASGLLSTKIGGPSVFPPQPASVSTDGAYGPLTWTASTGEDRYRRSLYTFAKRTAPFAMFNTFDGPTGEACVARREVSNTPLQALTLLNDVMMMEMAQALGKLVANQSGDTSAKATALFRRCMTRPPTLEEQTMLIDFYQKQAARFTAKELDPTKLAGAKDASTPEMAAWVAVARAVLNLDEAITKE